MDEQMHNLMERLLAECIVDCNRRIRWADPGEDVSSYKTDLVLARACLSVINEKLEAA